MKAFGFLAGVLSLGCLVTSTTQAEPMVPPRTTAIHLHNNTEHTLHLVKTDLVHGDWTPKLQPPKEIKPGATGYWKSESGGVANSTGPQGNIRYSMGVPQWHTFGISPSNAARAGTPMISVSRSPDQVDVFYFTPDGGINSVWWSAKEGKWSAPYNVAPAGAARADSSLAGFSRAPGNMDIFWITPKGEIATRPFDNNKWRNTFTITGPDVTHRQTDLAAVFRGALNIDIYYIGKDSAIHSVSWRGKEWIKPVSHTPANSARDGSSLTATSRTNDEIHVFYANKEGGLSTVWWRGKWNGPGAITGKSLVADGSNLAALSLDPKHLAVFWVNKEGAVSTIWSVTGNEGGKWHGPDILSAPKSARPRSPITSLNRNSKHIDVFWLNPEGALMTTYFQSGGQWGKAYAVTAPGVARADAGMFASARVGSHLDVFWIDGKSGLTTSWWDEKAIPEIYISWTNPFVDSQYKNTYHEQAPPDYSLSYTGGQGSHAEVNYVLEKSTIRTVKGFDQSIHGFKFKNTDWKAKGIKLPVVSITLPKPVGQIDISNTSEGMCGGMVYAVIDYFLAGKKIPQTMSPPSTESDPLFKYLKQRLIESWDVTGTGPNYIKFMRHDYPDADEGVVQSLGLMKGRSYVIAREEWPKVKADIDANRLSPIGLVQTISYNPADIGKNHQVLVYGYKLSGNLVTLYYYDPSSPADKMELRFTIGDLAKRIDILRFRNNVYDAKPINTFFRTTYRPPPASLVKPN